MIALFIAVNNKSYPAMYATCMTERQAIIEAARRSIVSTNPETIVCLTLMACREADFVAHLKRTERRQQRIFQPLETIRGFHISPHRKSADRPTGSLRKRRSLLTTSIDSYSRKQRRPLRAVKIIYSAVGSY